MTDHHMKAREEAVARAIRDALDLRDGLKQDMWFAGELHKAARAAIAVMTTGEDAGWGANSDPISCLYAIADRADPLGLVTVQAGHLRALVAEHRCGLSGEDALREALERIADYPATEGGDCFTLQRIARRALLATKHDRQDA